MININPSTLIFQIINFLVMVGILAWFFFKPVIKMLDERAKRVSSALDEAQQREEEAQAMHAEYERKLIDANELVVSMKQQAQQELEESKQRFINEAQQEIQQMRNKAKAELEDSRRQAIHQHRLELGQLVTVLGARLIREAGGDTLQESVVQEFVKRLETLSSEPYQDKFKNYEQDEIVSTQLVSADALAPEILARIQKKIETLADHPVEIHHKINPDLVAGATLRFGDTLIDGSLEGQLDHLRGQYIRELELTAE